MLSGRPATVGSCCTNAGVLAATPLHPEQQLHSSIALLTGERLGRSPPAVVGRGVCIWQVRNEWC